MRISVLEIVRLVFAVFFLSALLLLAIGKPGYSYSTAPDFQWKSISFDSLDVHYFDEGRTDASAVIFIHGWSCDAYFWRFQVPDLISDYRIIAIDLPGFGRSGKPNDRDYTLDLFAGALGTVLQAEKIVSPVLVGHSMGYAVARHFVLRNPGIARAIVNVDGAYFRPPQEEHELEAWEAEAREFAQGFSGEGREVFVRNFIEGTFYGRTSEELRAEILSKMLSADEYTSASAMKEFVKAVNWEESFFDLPFLAIYSQTDFLPHYQHDYFKSIFPDPLYYVWHDTGHFPMMETPERFNSTLRDFLKELQD